VLATRPQVNRLVTVNPRLANRTVNRAFLQPALTVLQYYGQCLEDVEEYGGLHDNFQTFTLYRGKKSLDDEEDEASRMAGYFKVPRCIWQVFAALKRSKLRLFSR